MSTVQTRGFKCPKCECEWPDDVAIVCVSNSTTEVLEPDQEFTGEWISTLDFGVVVIGVIANGAGSAVDGLRVEWSADGVSVTQDDVFTVSADRGKVFTFGPANEYFRVRYINGAVKQTSFNLQTILRSTYFKPSSHRIQDSIVDEDDAELVKAVLTAITPNFGFLNIGATDSGNLRVTEAESGLAIAKGDVTGTSFIHKFGNAPDFDTLDGFVTVWDGADDGGIDEMQYTYSATAIIDSLSSSINGDVVDIEVQGLDVNYELVIQTITLTGQARAALDTDLIRVFRLKNVGAVDLVGTVYCYEDTPLIAGVPILTNLIRAVIQIGNNQTLMAVFTIPDGQTGYMRDWYASIAGAKKTSVHSIRLIARPFGQVFQLKHLASIVAEGTSYIQHKYTEPEVFLERTDVEMLSNSDEDQASISAGFDIVLVNN